MNTVLSRRKRDSPENIYRHCVQAGNCPDDVKNKIEGNTLADRLLRWLSSVIYLGGLGIGTGRGTGGSTGYNPLSTPSRVNPGGTIIRPTIPVDSLGPSEIIPIDIIDPAGSAVIPLEELPAETTVIAGGEGIGVGGPVDTPSIEVVTAPDPINDVIAASGHPTVIGTEDEGVAILDVQPIEPPAKRLALEVRPKSSTPHISVLSSTTDFGQSSDINVFVDAHFTGDTVGYEMIPLETLHTRAEFQIEAPPRTSTPRDILNRTVTRFRDLYGRRVQQVATRNTDFLGQPARVVEFGFENPAFDPDVTMRFEQDVAEAVAAPDPDFADIRTLGRPRFSQTEEGRVRFSRLGQRGTLQTRSGLTIGQAVHFYYDLSTIDTIDAIELSNLGEHTGDLSVVDGLAESSFIDTVANSNTTYTDADLVDPLAEDFRNAHLVLNSNRRNATFTLPQLPQGLGVRTFVDDIASDLFVSYPQQTITPGFIPITPIEPYTPPLLYDFESHDFMLHPSHRRRKRKRIAMF
ncbi:L2 [Human papillomavirus type 194]|nr:L2 [Human papillomavirus type 194]